MFLEIMKSFKAEAIDTPGVIQKVSELFKGHNNLILGFNTFLPPGFRIDSADLPDDSRPPTTQVQQPTAQAHSLPPPPPTAGLMPHFIAHGHPQMLQQQMLFPGAVMDGSLYMNPTYYSDAAHNPYTMMMNPEALLQQQQQLQAQQQAASTQAAGQPVEFDHAINYVTKIKRRFTNDSDTYKAFLEILHNYQKEQKSIKEVLDQVSELFKDHPDLLKEFTYFLPDGVRDKAKQEISRIQNRRRKEESRKAEKKDLGLKSSSFMPGKKEIKDRLSQTATGGMLGAGMMMAPSIMSAGMLMGAGYKLNQGMPAEMEDMLGKDDRDAKSAVQVKMTKVPRVERKMFDNIRLTLNNRERWYSFLKCLELFRLEVLTRQDLLTLCADLFVGNMELLQEFDRFLVSRGVTDDSVEDAWFCLPVVELDFSQSRRCTPSYRSLPPTYPKPPCSERTALCRMVLNDTWVSVPSSQAEESSFKSAKRNQYEEALFKCEDERYELDMVIESNLSTINILEYLSKTIAERDAAAVAKAEPLRQFKFDRRTFNVIHMKAIARVYGEKAQQAFEMLRKSPASAIPIILNRLRIKDAEWRVIKSKMNEVWREVQEKNYVKSLDHSSYQFKQVEKKLLSQKHMLIEAKESPDKKMSFEMGDAIVHRYAHNLMATHLERSVGRSESESILTAYERTVARLFDVKTFGGKPLVTQPKNGTKVLTRYGVGTVGASGEVKLAGSGSIVKVPREQMYEYTQFPFKSDSATSSLDSPSLPCFVGSSGYLFVRFYALLYDRLMRTEALCEMKEGDMSKGQVKHVTERNGSDASPSGTPTGEVQMSTDEVTESLFDRTLEQVRQFLGGQLDGNRFEDQLYDTLGTSSYFLFTIDKLMSSLVRALQGMINDACASKVTETLSKYNEKRSASNACEVYRAMSEALMVTTGVHSVRVRVNPGTNPVFPPHKRSAEKANNASNPSEDRILASMDVLWESPTSIVLELLDSIPQAISSNNASRSLSPVEFDAQGSPVINDMGEIEFVAPVKFELRQKPTSLAAIVSGEDTPRSAKRLEVENSTLSPSGTVAAPTMLSIFNIEKVSGSDDVFRRITAYKSESQTEKDWWKSSIQAERTASPVPEESDSPEENDNEAPPPAKRLRAGANVQLEGDE